MHLAACRLDRGEGVGDKAVDPLFPDRAGGQDRRALRQDPHVRRRPRRRRYLLRVASYRPGDQRCWRICRGTARADDLLRPAIPDAPPDARRSGAEFLAVPAAFTSQTGEAHWHALLRARAIENGSFVLAAAQGGTHEDGRATFGHSLMIDPMGKMVAEAGPTGCDLCRRRSGGGVDRRAGGARCSTAGGFELLGRWREPMHLHAVGGHADPLTLVCDSGHEFESSSELCRLRGAGERGSSTVRPAGRPRSRRPIMAPRLGRKTVARPPEMRPAEPRSCRRRAEALPVAMIWDQEKEIRSKLKGLHAAPDRQLGPSSASSCPKRRARSAATTSERRSIYGEASKPDADALREQGIESDPLPVLPDERN